MMKNLGQMMKQVQELQERMQAVQAKLENLSIEGRAGGGLVQVTLNGKGAMIALALDESLLKPGEKEILEDLIIAAHADARNKTEATGCRRNEGADGRPADAPGFNAVLIEPAVFLAKAEQLCTMRRTTGTEIERLIQLLAKLPGLGPRSARRAALHLIKNRDKLLRPLAEALADARREGVGLLELWQCRYRRSMHDLPRPAPRPRRSSAWWRRSAISGRSNEPARSNARLPRARRHAFAVEGRGPEDLNIAR